MATEDIMYRESSQFQLWSFTKAQLAAKRDSVNAHARRNILARLVAGRADSAAASSANTPNPSAAAAADKFPPDFLTAAEEAAVATNYTAELIRAARHTGIEDTAVATAAVFFRRFYVANSVMTYSPKNMVWVALFVGCKAEGRWLSVDEFGPEYGVKDPRGSILGGEYLMCLGLRFAFDVKHPYRALRGAGMELRRMPGLEEARIEKAEKRAHDILKWSPLITDAYFHYTPSQIMLAALSLADRGLAERLIQETFHYVPPAQEKDGASTPNTNASTGTSTPVVAGNNHGAVPPAWGRKSQLPIGKGRDGGKNGNTSNLADIIGPDIRDKVLATVEACRDMLAGELPERGHWGNKAIFEAEISPLLQKMQKCRDPDRWNVRNLQRIRQEQRELKRAARRARNGGDSGVDDSTGDDDDEDDDGLDPDASSSEDEASAARRRRRRIGPAVEDAAVFGEAAVGRSIGGAGGEALAGSGPSAREPKRRKVDANSDPFGGPL